MCRLNKFTETLYVNENTKVPEGSLALLEYRIVKPSALMVKQNPRTTAAMEVFHSTLREIELDVGDKAV